MSPTDRPPVQPLDAAPTAVVTAGCGRQVVAISGRDVIKFTTYLVEMEGVCASAVPAVSAVTVPGSA